MILNTILIIIFYQTKHDMNLNLLRNTLCTISYKDME